MAKRLISFLRIGIPLLLGVSLCASVTATETEPLQPSCKAATLAQAKHCHDGDMFLFVPGTEFLAGEIDLVNPTRLMSLFCDFRYSIRFVDYQTGIACIYRKKMDTDKTVDEILAKLAKLEKEAE